MIYDIWYMIYDMISHNDIPILSQFLLIGPCSTVISPRPLLQAAAAPGAAAAAGCGGREWGGMGTWDGGAPVMVGYGWFINPIDAIDIVMENHK